MTPVKVGYSIREAAEAVGIGRSVMCNLIRAGDIESFKIGARRIIPAGAINHYVARKLAESRTTPDVTVAGPTRAPATINDPLPSKELGRGNDNARSRH
jgi:excisionase family DNA binding protein